MHARRRPAHSDFAYDDDGGGITHITADHPGREGVGALPGAPKPSRNSARPLPHLRSRTASAQGARAKRPTDSRVAGRGIQWHLRAAAAAPAPSHLVRAQPPYSVCPRWDAGWDARLAVRSKSTQSKTHAQQECGRAFKQRVEPTLRCVFRVTPIPPPGQTVAAYVRALLERAAPASYMLGHAIEFAVPAAYGLPPSFSFYLI
ncbi:hypothetical protein FB451DRAFT_1554778 [Mycena latifolia]|nr:hypothetical protein FB451DRAFT_1554778 [Mycena latifolia]